MYYIIHLFFLKYHTRHISYSAWLLDVICLMENSTTHFMGIKPAEWNSARREGWYPRSGWCARIVSRDKWMGERASLHSGSEVSCRRNSARNQAARQWQGKGLLVLGVARRGGGNMEQKWGWEKRNGDLVWSIIDRY